MNEKQVLQNKKIERLFNKFDADGSQCLDYNEMYELFENNQVEIDKETLKIMFNNEKFTL